MSFINTYDKYSTIDVDGFLDKAGDSDVLTAINKDRPDIADLFALLSPSAQSHLEGMAQKAHSLTLQYFGRTIQLYTPMYLSNHCINQCLYCGFNVKNNTDRKKLTLEEVKREAEYVSATGLKHILILTGGSREESPVSYIKECIGELKKHFTSISLETYALTQDEYAELVDEGLDGLTIYQEVYDRDIYDKVHLAGPKKDYSFRLDAAERALESGMRAVNIGALLGLGEWRKEVFYLGLHTQYLQNKFTDAEIGVSVPRLRPHLGKFESTCKVADKDLVQIILVLRIFLPRIGITISTREDPDFRDHLLPLGVTRISAGSTTAVGGHTRKYEHHRDEQFEISDKRGVDEIKTMLRRQRYQPVMKDWMNI